MKTDLKNLLALRYVTVIAALLWLLFLVSLPPLVTHSAHAVDSGPSWTATGNLNTGRYHHRATLLTNGKVLVVGGYSRCSFTTGCTTLSSAELYDPATGTWSATGSVRTPRSASIAVRLANGKVLIAGGGTPPNFSDLYDPATGAWSPTGNLNTGRYDATGTLLANGKVLIAGGATTSGNNVTVVNTAELYDPATGVWSPTGNMNSPRLFHSATLLPNGKVLVAGGESNLAVSNIVRSAELYDPATGTWSLTGNMSAARQTHTATLLRNKVLVTSGFANSFTALNSAELYDPATGTWSATGNLSIYRETATLLPNGKVLATGGDGGSITTELYDPATGTWSAGANLTTKRNNHTITFLANNKVLATSGTGDGENGLNSAELFDAAALGGVAVTVSGASYGAEVTSETIASAFGVNLASGSAAATSLPLPTVLAGVTVKVRDSLGTERDAPLFYVSPLQINYLIPAGTASGTATVTMLNNGTQIATGTLQIVSVAPGLFAANSNAQGVAAADVLRVKANNAQTYESLLNFDPAQNKFVPTLIDLGPATDLVFVELYGTGIRFRSDLSAVSATVGGVSAQVFYAGAQGQFVGLDQVNVLLPRSLAGRGEVNIALTVDGKAANVVTVGIL